MSMTSVNGQAPGKFAGLAEDILKVGASGMGVLMSVSGIGAIIGSIALASLPNRKRGLMLIVGSLILGAALVAFSFSVSWYLSLGLVILVGLGQAARMTRPNITSLSIRVQETNKAQSAI